MPPNFDQFAQCFASLTGHSRFNWQERLFACLCAGNIPQRCDIPTGLGKTSVLAIWLLALAEQAQQTAAKPTLPRRLVYIVDRRVVVDQATQEAEKIRAVLDKAALDTPLAAIAKALHGLAAADSNSAFELSTLRGALADNRRWSRDPARPAIIIGTVDMIGSRLLFSGYGGLGRYGRSQHAALLGQDTLVVLDEAQLAPAFTTTLVEIEQQVRRQHGELIPPFAVMRLTATQPRLRNPAVIADRTPPVTLEPEDLQQTEVRQRVQASKTLQFSLFPTGDNVATQARNMANKAVELAKSGGAVAVFANTIDLLDKIQDALTSAPHKVSPEECLLQLTGQMRGHERDRAFSSGDKAHPVFKAMRERHSKRAKTGSHRPVFLLATAAAEVGVNFDADHAVCDLVPLERMAQRLGRVNRFGDHSAAQVNVFAPENIASSPRREYALTFELLKHLPPVVGEDGAPIFGTHSASPEQLCGILGNTVLDPKGEACTPFSDPPPLDAARLDDWSLTSLLTHEFPRPQVAYWLHGIAPDDAPTVRFAWREELRYACTGPEATDMAQTVSPLPRELVQLPISKAIKWLVARATKHFGKRRAAVDLPHGEFAAIRSAAGEWEPRELQDFLKKDNFEDDIAGVTIVLPTTFGGLQKGGQPDDSCDEKVSDVLEEPAFGDLTGEKLYHRVLLKGSSAGWTARDLIGGAESVEIARADTIGRITAASARFFDGSGENLRYRLLPRKKEAQEPGDTDEENTSSGRGFRVEYFAATVTDVETADDTEQASLRGKKRVLLEAHLKKAEEFARRIVARLTLPEPIQQAVIQAAAWHDLGKSRDIWQRAVGNRKLAEVWAKSPNPRFDHGQTRGYRHEFGSMMEAAEKPELHDHPERDLILHLIAAHHGHARPGFGEQAYDVSNYLLRDCRDAAKEAELRFERLLQRFGWWGLAYLEALVKCSDALASDAEDDTKPVTSISVPDGDKPRTTGGEPMQLSFDVS